MPQRYDKYVSEIRLRLIPVLKKTVHHFLKNQHNRLTFFKRL